MAIRNRRFEAVQFFRGIEHIYETDAEGNPILTGVELNDSNKNIAVNFSVDLIRIILETGSGQVIPADAPMFYDLARVFNYNLPAYAATILYFLGLIQPVVPA
jgi:hypothetical protein